MRVHVEAEAAADIGREAIVSPKIDIGVAEESVVVLVACSPSRCRCWSCRRDSRGADWRTGSHSGQARKGRPPSPGAILRGRCGSPRSRRTAANRSTDSRTPAPPVKFGGRPVRAGLPIVSGAPTSPAAAKAIFENETLGASVEADPEIAAHIPVRADLEGQWAWVAGRVSGGAVPKRSAAEAGAATIARGASEREQNLHWPPQNRRVDATYGDASRAFWRPILKYRLTVTNCYL